MMRFLMLPTAVTLAFLTACTASSDNRMIGDLNASDIGGNVRVLGNLQMPLGQEVTIHGFKHANGPFENCFTVNAVDGKPLTPTRDLLISGIEAWPEKTEATIRGYETGTIRFVKIEDTNVFGPDFTPYQKMFLSFVPLQIVEPPNLKLDVP